MVSTCMAASLVAEEGSRAGRSKIRRGVGGETGSLGRGSETMEGSLRSAIHLLDQRLDLVPGSTSRRRPVQAARRGGMATGSELKGWRWATLLAGWSTSTPSAAAEEGWQLGRQTNLGR